MLAAAALGAPLAAVCALVPGDTARALLVLGLVLPVVLGQDAVRYAFSTLQRPHLALTSDLVRLACVLGALSVQDHGASPARLVAVWGLSALPALLLSAALLHRATAGSPLRLRPMLRRGHLGQRFTVEFGVGNATGQLSVLGLGAVGTPSSSAHCAARPPSSARSTSSTPPPRPSARRCSAASATSAAGSGPPPPSPPSSPRPPPSGPRCWPCCPMPCGRQLLGDTWPVAAALLPATGSQYAAMAVGTCGLLALRMLDPRTTLAVQIVFSLTAVAFLAGGYAVGGVPGAAWGLFLGSLCKAVATWIRVARLRRRAVAPDRAVAATEDAVGGRA